MKKSIIVLLLALSSFSASAQSTLKSSYFMDRMVMTHKLNPALSSEYGYFSMPMLGDLTLGVNSNLTLDKFIYPLDNGNLGTFLHPEVDRATAMAAFDKHNMVNQNLNLTLISTGFYAFNGFNTLDLSLRENATVDLSGSLFDFMLGAEPDATSVYHLGGNTVDVLAYAELSLGHSHKINDNLTVGAKLKYLVGIANANVNIDRIDLETSSSRVSANAHASGDVAIMGLPLAGSLADMSLDALDFSNGLNGGFAVDLGATYKLDKFNFSLALTDLGAINWHGASNISLEAETEFEGFKDLDIKDFEGSTSGVFDDLQDDLESLMDPEFIPQDNYRTTLCPTLNVAAEYDIFDNRKITAGLLSSTYFGPTTVAEFMLAATFRPVSWFSLALTGTTTTLGTTYFGWVMSISPRWVNIYVGSDSMPTRITPMGIPYDNSNLNLSLGLSFPFGKLHSRQHKAIKVEACSAPVQFVDVPEGGVDAAEQRANEAIDATIDEVDAIVEEAEKIIAE